LIPLSGFESANASEILAWAIGTYGDSFAIATSFQKEGMVIVDLASRITSDVRVFTIDTGRLPDETYRMMETVRQRYGIRVEVVFPEREAVEQLVTLHGPNLFYGSVPCRERCCEVRKVRPLERKLATLKAWASGLRREQSATRANVSKVEKHDELIKLNPLADWTAEQVEEHIRRHHVPLHPLYARGYTSIGCAPCTRAVSPGEDERAGRWWWELDAKKECGIHFGADGVVRRDGAADQAILTDAETEAEEIEMHKGFTLWFTGMSGAGKSTISRALELRLREQGARVEVLDGDVVRTHLSKGLGFSKEDRDENIRRIGFVCELLSRNGVIAVAAAISPYRAVREEVRARIPNFVEVYVECPIEVLAERDVKGLYKRALAGEIPHFTGISDPYEPPLHPEVVVNSATETAEESVERIWATLERLGLVSFDRSSLSHQRI
jgi:phosphoadenosine phosphosulfate reductase